MSFTPHVHMFGVDVTHSISPIASRFGFSSVTKMYKFVTNGEGRTSCRTFIIKEKAPIEPLCLGAVGSPIGRSCHRLIPGTS
jgi:hypothetical protein